MNFQQLLQGLETLKRFYWDQTGCHIEAGVRMIIARKTDQVLDEGAVETMIFLEWTQAVIIKGDFYAIEDYDPEEPWIAHV